MATNNPISVELDFVEIQTGPWSGAVQNVGHAPLVGIIEPSEGGQPDPSTGGFAIYSQPTPISIAADEVLWVRSAGGIGVVVLA